MAVPKRKTSQQRRNTRSSANSKIAVPTLTECSHCHEQKPGHTACPHCGYYNGQPVLVISQKKAKQ
jgi:large subunit ribosomal protein L32